VVSMLSDQGYVEDLLPLSISFLSRTRRPFAGALSLGSWSLSCPDGISTILRPYAGRTMQDRGY
jgi:hypothetical protein